MKRTLGCRPPSPTCPSSVATCSLALTSSWVVLGRSDGTVEVLRRWSSGGGISPSDDGDVSPPATDASAVIAVYADEAGQVVTLDGGGVALLRSIQADGARPRLSRLRESATPLLAAATQAKVTALWADPAPMNTEG